MSLLTAPTCGACCARRDDEPVNARPLRDDFARYFGRVHPLVALAGSICLGTTGLLVLRAGDWGWVDVFDTSARGFVVAAVAAVSLAAIAIVADSTIRFADDINVSWPNSLVFYSAVAIVAEVVFHVVPLAVLELLFEPDFDGASLGADALVCVTVVALIETVFQVVASVRNGARVPLVVFVTVHLFVVGVAQVLLFWRFGVLAMVGFRLVYYALWHVTWGHLRLAAVS